MRTNREPITRVTLDEAMRMKGKTDYARLDAMTDDDIARAVESDPTMAPIGSIDWDKASLVIPPTAKDIITLRVDHDVLEWLRSTGPGYQTRINQVLRTWYDAALQEKGLAIQTAAEEHPTVKRHGVKRLTVKRPTVKRPTVKRPTVKRPTVKRPTVKRAVKNPASAGKKTAGKKITTRRAAARKRA
jgi:uncharacterized protein (DUF4415 family)